MNDIVNDYCTYIYKAKSTKWVLRNKTKASLLKQVIQVIRNQRKNNLKTLHKNKSAKANYTIVNKPKGNNEQMKFNVSDTKTIDKPNEKVKQQKIKSWVVIS